METARLLLHVSRLSHRYGASGNGMLFIAYDKIMHWEGLSQCDIKYHHDHKSDCNADGADIGMFPGL